MSRTPRNVPPGTVQHVISRFVNREIRVTRACEREQYLKRVAPALRHTDWLALAYALMGNHHHWSMQSGEAPLSAFFKPLHGGFAGWLNAAQGRLGPVYAGRPQSITFDEEQTALLIAYIHNNPVRAGIVDDPLQSTWTSHGAYVGTVRAPEWLDVERGLALCGFDSSPSGRLAFHDFVLARSGDSRDDTFSERSAQRLRSAVREVLQAPVEVTTSIGASEQLRLFVRPHTPVRPPAILTPRQLLRLVASEAGVTVDQLRGTTRVRSVVEARRYALALWTRGLGRSQARLAAALGITDSAASQLLRRVSSETIERVRSNGLVIGYLAT